MRKDVQACVDAARQSDDTAVATMGARWQRHLDMGAWSIREDAFWCRCVVYACLYISLCASLTPSLALQRAVTFDPADLIAATAGAEADAAESPQKPKKSHEHSLELPDLGKFGGSGPHPLAS